MWPDQLAVCESGNRYMRQVYEQLLLSANDSLLYQYFLCEPEHVRECVQPFRPRVRFQLRDVVPWGAISSHECFDLRK